MSSNLQPLFDSFDEGMLLLAPDGLVRMANRAAMQMLPVIPGKKLAVEELLIQLNAANQGYLRLPLGFDMNASAKGAAGDVLHVNLNRSPVSDGFLVVLRNVTESQQFDTVLSNLASLLSAELEAPMEEFSANMGALLVSLVPDLAAREQLSEEMRNALLRGKDLVGRIKQLAVFAQVFGRSPVLASDRIPLHDLISALLLRVQPLLEEHDIKARMTGTGIELPVIYGSREWLVEALNGYVEYAVSHCLDQSDLEIAVRPYGNFVNLQIKNRGRSITRNMKERSFLPFNRMVNQSAGKTTPPRDLGLGLALCKRIVELHRGHIRLEEEDGEVMSFELELPAGAPPESINPELDLAQARRYAEDLTRLMTRQREAAQAR